MKKKEKEELRAQTKEELIKKLRDARSELEKQKFDPTSEQKKDTNLLRKKKKDIARMLTYLKQKEGKNGK